MKGVLKKTKDFAPAIILSLVASFTVFIYEPVTMYANNIDDFWFDFYTLIGPSFLFFIITFITLLAFFFIIKLIAKRLKHPNFYYITLSLASACFICAYIHSNFLTSFLPPLDGTTFDWSDSTANIVSIVVCLILLLVTAAANKGSRKHSRQSEA